MECIILVEVVFRNKSDDLENKIEVHNRASQYYLSLSLPEPRTKKEDVQSLIEAHHHACMAQQYNTAAAILFDYNLYEDLDRWGHSRTLIELYSGLLLKDQFKEKPLATKKTYKIPGYPVTYSSGESTGLEDLAGYPAGQVNLNALITRIK